MTSVPNPTLEVGLAALERGDYERAIAHLQGVCETELDEALVTRASVALVRAYEGSGKVENAIALLQSLQNSFDPQLREWAASTLANLSSAPTRDVTGFVPLDSPPPAQTGFVAFDGTPPQATTPTKGYKRLSNPPTSKTKPTRRGASEVQKSSSPKQPASPKATGKPAPKNSSDAVGASQKEPRPLLPVPYSPPPTPHPSVFSPRPRWRNSGRAERWKALKPVKRTRLWLIELGTAIALFWVLRFVLRFLMGTINNILVRLPYLQPFQPFYRDPTQGILIFFVILLVASPWLMDGLLRRFYGFEALPLTQLASRSPESAKGIQRLCRQRRLPLPKLGILPTDAPVAMTYGNLRRTARIVVSQGLLEQLDDNEIAAIYAGQLGHILHWDFVLMSVATLVLQVPYTIYWQVAHWTDQLPDLIARRLPSYQRWLPPILLAIGGAIASLSYGIFWVLRLPLLWFSRARHYFSDRLAVETTGNPNGLTRAFLKIALGIADDVQQQGQTNAILEGFDLMMPVGYKQALMLGSLPPQTYFESLLQWDCANPYRNWLIVTATHPLMGDRLHLLARYAQYWQLAPELDLPPLVPPERSRAALFAKLQNSYKALPLPQMALLYGLILGIVLRLILWIIGGISSVFGFWRLIWLYNADLFLNPCMLIAFSLSIFFYINGYFPDIKPPKLQTEPHLKDLLTNSTALPPDSLPIQITGKLLGRPGLLNWLGQDLILQTSTGLVKLHYFSILGPVGNLLPKAIRPSDLVNQQVTASGWFRRGVTPWMDLDALRTPNNQECRGNYPLWLTILAVLAAIWGAYLIWQV
ncbi:MAG: M48 family metalloprotease [Kastovskya adunca ATA6-11-RM4]|jgi:Zn-dependent protease with chaperone function|nr:M48 family metalloprotease [Kastovskya adunca ATA6-11-RM4]